MEIKVRFSHFGIFHIYSYWRLMAENIPSLQPNPDLKPRHARAALNCKNKTVAFDHGAGKAKSPSFAQATRQKTKKPLSPATHR
jgi:hypothetical protein